MPNKNRNAINIISAQVGMSSNILKVSFRSENLDYLFLNSLGERLNTCVNQFNDLFGQEKYQRVRSRLSYEARKRLRRSTICLKGVQFYEQQKTAMIRL